MKQVKYCLILVFVTAFFLFSTVNLAISASKINNLSRMIIMFSETGPDKIVNIRAKEALIKAFGGKPLLSLSIINGFSVMLPPNAELGLKNAKGIAWVEQDVEIFALEDTLGWGVNRIDAEKVWGGSEAAVNVIGNGGAGVDVAILDSGIDYNHPDLMGNYKQGGFDFVNNDNDPMDDHYHGTHVAGIVSAMCNQMGVIGVAPEANLHALKVLDSAGGGYASYIISALEWCIDKGIDVANMSLGSYMPSRALQKACDRAYNSGVLLVAAAGNDGSSRVTYPAKYDSVIAVSAIDQLDNPALFSNYGNQIELAAPGVYILSTVPGGGYAYANGTSMAAPHVTGTAALIISGGFAVGANAVRDRLNSSSEDLGAPGMDIFFGSGLVDAEEAASASICDDGICDSDETCDICPQDCGVCECGNGTCDSDETCISCPEDCSQCPPECGNGVCESGEDCHSCPVDCGECQCAQSGEPCDTNSECCSGKCHPKMKICK
jgi:hypothetical protein